MNQSCQYTKEDIWKYYSGALSRKSETELQEHIISCTSCQMKLKQLQNLDEFLAQEDENIIDLPDTDDSNEKTIILKKSLNWKKILIISSTIAAVIALIIYFIFPRNSTKYPISPEDMDKYGPGNIKNIDSSHIKSVEIDTIQLNDLLIEESIRDSILDE